MPSHVLYIDPISAPCRAVHLHLSLLEAQPAGRSLDVEVRPISLFKEEHKSPEFLAINPQHTVPALITPFGTLLESRAVMIYLAELAQARDPSAEVYYPRQIFSRAKVHQLLNWDHGTFYRAIGAAVYPSFKGEEPTHEQLQDAVKVVKHLDEHVLGHGPFVAGEAPTIADFSVAMGLSMLQLPNLVVDDCPRVEAWAQRMTSAPAWGPINEQFDALVASKRSSSEVRSEGAAGESPAPDDVAGQDVPSPGAEETVAASDATPPKSHASKRRK